LNLPLDGAVTALSTLVQGPQITGSVQTTSHGLLLEASLSGGGFNLNWRVDENDVNADRQGKEPDAAIVDRMICQLGYRIFTDLNYEQTGTREWRAAEHYVEGLRAFRAWRRQGNSTEGLIALQSAQKEFLAACPEDRAFMRSRYNLGVIYSYQHVDRAAYAIFEEAINSTAGAAPGLPGTASYERDRTDLASAHYAAAVAANGLGRSDRVRYHCGLALELNPWHAGAWKVRAEAATEQSKPRAAGLRRACAISWWNLCRAVWVQGARAIEVSRAAGYAAGLAANLGGSAASIRAMKQALRLHPELPGLWLELGKLYLKRNDRESAVAAFETANRESEQALFWAWIACISCEIEQSKPHREVRAKTAWERAKAILQDDLGQVETITSFWREMEAGRPESLSLPYVVEWRKEFEAISARAKEILAVQSVLLSNGSLDGAAKLMSVEDKSFAGIVKWLTDHYQSDPLARQLSPSVLYRFLPWLLQQSISQKDGRRDDLLRSIQVIVADLSARPMRDLERFNLANLYRLLRLQDRAAAESKNARTIDPTREALRVQSIEIALDMFGTVTDIETRRKALRQAFDTLRELADDATGNMWNLDLNMIPWIHFTLATISFELLDYTTAQKSLEIAVACRFNVPESLQWLALVHFRCGAFEEAEKAYRSLSDFVPADANDSDAKRQRDFQLAATANHTAAALAEQGFVTQALQRWQEGTMLSARLTLDPPIARGLGAAQALCKGIILLAAGIARTDAGKLGVTPFPVPATSSGQLKEAIEAFRESIVAGVDVSYRADGFYRTAIACQELITLETSDATTLRRRAEDALNRAETADRRGEYVDRIAALRKNLTSSA
jgi:tetratricopeptide (TPR) repeat protein